MTGVHAVLTPLKDCVVMSCFTRGQLIGTQVVTLASLHADMAELLAGHKPETMH